MGALPTRPGRAGAGSQIPEGDREMLRELRRALRKVADPRKAPGMQAYMRSSMPYHGVPAPAVRRVVRGLWGEREWDRAASWRSTTWSLWTQAEFREERYGAIELSGLAGARSFQTPSSVGLYEKMIRSGAWWDYVDELAVRRIGPILRSYPSVAHCMRRWARSDDLWKRRTSIICQVGSRGELDVELLADCIAPSLGSREFFLRKAIGWALRQHARVDPGWVRRFVTDHEGELSGLSRREALRHLDG